jgi:hypothetical protein
LSCRPGGSSTSARLTLETRRNIHADVSRWRQVTPACGQLREALLELLRDCGAFLEVGLYQEALT